MSPPNSESSYHYVSLKFAVEPNSGSLRCANSEATEGKANTSRTSPIRQVCPEPVANRRSRFSSSTSTAKSARPVPVGRFLRHANSARSPAPSITCRTTSWPCGHAAPPLSGVWVRYAFFFRWDVPSVTPCLEACWYVAPTLRLSLRAITLVFTFSRASVFKVRTSSFVQERSFPIHYSCRPSVAVSKQKEPRICGALAPLHPITSNPRITRRCG